jgi:hypothetical protein
MKKLNLIRLLFLCFILFSCETKKEKKQTIIYNNNSIQNYKYDEEDLVNKKAKKSNHRKHNLEENISDTIQ